MEETGRKPPKPAIAKSGIRLVPDHGSIIEAKRLDRRLCLLLEAEIDRDILDQSPDEKLHREVINPLQPLLISLPRAREPEIDHRSEEHTSELQSRGHLVCRLLLEKKKKT